MAMEFLGAMLWGSQMQATEPEFMTLFKEAMAHIQTGEIEAGCDKLMRSVRLNDDHKSISQRAAMLVQFSMKLERFDDVLEITAKFMDQIPALIIPRATILQKLERFQESAECFEKAMALPSAANPGNQEMIFGLYAKTLESLQKWDTLKRLTEELLVKYPSTASYHDHLIQCLDHLDEFELMSKHVTSLEENYGDSPSIQFVLGRYYQKTENEKALECFEIAAQSDPKNENFQHFYIRSLLHNGKQDEASKHCQFLIDQDPENAHWIGVVGFLLFESADYESAAKHFQQCMELMPDEPGYVTDYAMALCEIPDRLETAKKVMVDILEKYPDSVPVQYRMARILHLEGDYQGSQALYLEILEKEPLRRRINMGYAHLLHTMGKYEESMKYFETAKNVDGKNPFYHYWYGLLLVDEHYERYQEGITSFEQCLEIKPFFHLSHYQLARVYCDILGTNQKEALEHMDKAVKIHYKSELYPKELERMKAKDDWIVEEEENEEKRE